MASLLLGISAKALSYASWVGRPTQRQKPSEAAHSSCVRLTDHQPRADGTNPDHRGLSGDGGQEVCMTRPHGPVQPDWQIHEAQERVAQQKELVRRSIVQGAPTQAAEDQRSNP